METWLFFGFILTVFSLLPIGIKKLIGKKRQPKKWIVFFINFLSISLFAAILIEFFLSLKNIYFTGYKTRTFLLISLVVCVTLHYCVTQYKNTFYRIFVQFILVATIFVTTVIGVVNLANYQEYLLFENNTYRIEKNWELSGADFMLPTLYRKKGIVESAYPLEYEKGNQTDYLHDFTKESITDFTINETDSSIRVSCHFKDGTTYFLSTPDLSSN